MENKELRQEQERQLHEKRKRILMVVGICILAVGIVLSIIGFISIFSSINGGGGMPKLFFLCIIGLPTFGIGLMLVIASAQREMSRYVKNEQMPVVKDVVEELTPELVRAVKAATDDGDKTVDEAEKGSVCPSCGRVNEAKNKYCDGCGTLLKKTCPHCGTVQEADDAYCGECGAKLN